MTDKLKETEDYLRTWLGNFQAASELAPVCSRVLGGGDLGATGALTASA
jgi:hypothetical protein